MKQAFQVAWKLFVVVAVAVMILNMWSLDQIIDVLSQFGDGLANGAETAANAVE